MNGASLADYRAVLLHLYPGDLRDVMDATTQIDLELDVRRRGLVSVEKAARMIEADGRGDGWLSAEVNRARARAALVPPHARPAVTRRSFTTDTEGSKP